MSPDKDGSTITTTTFWANATTGNNETCLSVQLVSDAMASGIAFVTSDTIKCQVLCKESGVNDNINRQPITVKVYSEDGATLRATMLALAHIGPNTTEWLDTGPRNKTVADGDALTTGYTTVAGDRLVIEIGGQTSSSGGNTVTGTQYIGTAGGGADLAENETDTTTTLLPWFEISRTVTFLAPDLNVGRHKDNQKALPQLPMVAGLSVAGTLLTTVLAVAATVYEVRAPIITPLRPLPQVLKVDVPQNILLSKLAQPFCQQDWKLPPPLLPRVPVPDIPNTLLSPLAPPIGRTSDWLILAQPLAPPKVDLPANQLLAPDLLPPFRQQDWTGLLPLPPVPKVDLPANQLLVPDLLPPFTLLIWPNLTQPSNPPQDAISNLLVSTLGAVIASPFFQSDWPMLTGPPGPLDRNTWLDKAKGNLRDYDACPAGPYNPTSAVNDASVGDVAWTTPQNAIASDDTYATCVTVAQKTQRLKATGFNFNISPTKIIAGIVVEVEAKTLTADRLVYARIVKGGVVHEEVLIGTNWTTVEGFVAYGISTSLWGQSWTPADINATDFGVVFSTEDAGPFTDTFSVDSVRITVYCADFPFSQLDWPALRGQSFVIGLRSEANNLLENTLGAEVVQPPFAKTDWPALTPITGPISSDAPPHLLDTTLAVPFSQSDWLNLRQIVIPQQTITPNLLTVPDLLPPFAQSDWMALARPLPPQQTITPNLLTVPDLLPPFVGAIPSQIRPALPAPATDLAQNLLETLLAPTIAPFVQNDWPVLQPALLSRTTNVSAYRVATQAPVIGPPGIFVQSDWPRLTPLRLATTDTPYNLTLGIPPPVSLPPGRTDWQLPPPLPPTPATKHSAYRLAAGAVDPGPPRKPFDWPNPIPKGRVRDLLTWTAKMPPLRPQPFFQRDFPNPIPKGRARDLLTWTAKAPPLRPKPFPQMQFPNPIPKGRSVSLLTWQNGVNLTGLSVVLRNRQSEWPVPRAKADFLQGFNVLIILSDPFAPLNWPNPRAPVRQNGIYSWTQSLSTTTLAPLVPIPISQAEWPNPVDTRFRREPSTWISELKINLIGQDTFFGGPGQVPNTAWDNPQIKQPSIELRTWISNLSQTTLEPFVQSPFYLTDWPNPKGAAPPITLKTWTENLGLYIVGPPSLLDTVTPFDWPNPRGKEFPVDLRTQSNDTVRWILATQAAAIPPPTNYDWPNPRGATPNLALKTWLDVYRIGLFSEGITFFAQAEWPNPTTRITPVALRTWIHALDIALLGQGQFFGAPGQVPGHDWKNPAGKPYPSSLRIWSNDLITGTLGVPVASPFSPVEFENPLDESKRRPPTIYWVPFNFLTQFPPSGPPIITIDGKTRVLRAKQRRFIIPAKGRGYAPMPKRP